MRKRLAIAALAVFALSLPGSALPAGGDTIAAAPEIPTGLRQFGSKKGVDFWHVFLDQGDELGVAYGSTDGDWVSVCLMPPTVTAPTGLGDDACIARTQALGKGSLGIGFATAPGDWTLAIGDGACFPHNFTLSVCAGAEASYEVTATVRRYTEVLLSLPAVARLKVIVLLQGTVAGASGGFVELFQRRQGKWASLALVQLDGTGSFSYQLKTPDKRGIYNYRAVYYGDDQHRPSGRSIAFRVI